MASRRSGLQKGQNNMEKQELALLVIGIDHGFGKMKTANYVFENGVEEVAVKPTLEVNTLCYDNKFYKVGEGRLALKELKTKDNSYFIATLKGVAMELMRAGITQAKVVLGVGVPFSRMGKEKDAFRDYLLREGEIEFTYSGTGYKIIIEDVYVYPQCYAAIIDKIRMYGRDSLIVDIGSKTIDIIYISNYVPVESRSTSIPEALIQCMEGIKNSVYQVYNRKISESIIQQMIIDGDAGIPADCKELVKRELEIFAKNIEAKLTELGFDLEMLPVVYAGGGAVLMRQYGTKSGTHIQYLEDICANAKGYEFLARKKHNS